MHPRVWQSLGNLCNDANAGLRYLNANNSLSNTNWILRAKNLINKDKPIPLLLARQCISGYGWYKNTDSYTVGNTLDMDSVHNACKKVISDHAKGVNK